MWFQIRGRKNFDRGFADGTIGHGIGFWEQRRIHVDCRGPLIIHPTSEWGVGIAILTAGHHPHEIVLDIRETKTDFRKIYRPVIVEEHAWIGSFSLLYNCVIGHHSVVSAGTVVAGVEVPPWCIVAGNPAQIIAKFDAQKGKFSYLQSPQPLKRGKPDECQRRFHSPTQRTHTP